eukprot:jgi/Hompol1/2400/HPOL_005985-RA
MPIPSLPLTPFKDQVGGHAAFLRFSDKALCKPLDPREHQFYELVEANHPNLKPFIATYLGVVNVTFRSPSSDVTSADGDWFLETTPVIILEHNKHLLEAYDELRTTDSAAAGTGTSAGSSNSGGSGIARNFNRKMQQQVLKEALSPKSLRARFAHLQNISQRSQPLVRKTSDSKIDSTDATAASIFLMDDEDHAVHSTNTPSKHAARAGDETREDRRITGISKHASAPPLPPSDSSDSARTALDSSPHLHARSPALAPAGLMAHSIGSNVSNTHSLSTAADAVSPMQTPDDMSASFNPWSLHLYNTKLSKLMPKPSDPDLFSGESTAGIAGSSNGSDSRPQVAETTHKFLLLEDLTEGMRHPCVLDLKMGTRQHGVFATPEKRASQERKCERSTSKKLGVRICGMQVYKQSAHSYFYLDKYVGRQIHAGNFKQNILSFLDNGDCFLVGLIPKILEKLRRLYRVISSMTTCRFYASSLLILYDGDALRDPTAPKREADIRMIDFSNSITNADKMRVKPGKDASTSASPMSALIPLQSPTSEPSKDILPSAAVSVLPAATLSEEPISSQPPLVAPSSDPQSATQATLTNMDRPPLPRTATDSAATADAKSTPSKEDDDSQTIYVTFPPTTKGPDNGYLLGLQTLISHFEEILSELGSDAR